MKISLTVTELWSVQDLFMDGQTDGQHHAIRRFFKTTISKGF